MQKHCPISLNNEAVRTFARSPYQDRDLFDGKVEMLMRQTSALTIYLCQVNGQAALEELCPYIAGDLGIAPLLAPLPELDVAKLRLMHRGCGILLFKVGFSCPGQRSCLSAMWSPTQWIDACGTGCSLERC